MKCWSFVVHQRIHYIGVYIGKISTPVTVIKRNDEHHRGGKIKKRNVIS